MGETKQIKEHGGNRTDLGGRRLLELVGLVGVVDAEGVGLLLIYYSIYNGTLINMRRGTLI